MIRAFFEAKLWAMQPQALSSFVEDINTRMALLTEDITVKTIESRDKGYIIEGSTAIIPLSGVIMESPPWWAVLFGNVSDPEIAVKAILAAQDDASISDIRLDIDSPGGTASGGQMLADFIGRWDGKPIRSRIGNIGASAAYWAASKTESIEARQLSEIGSVGVYAVYHDTSAAAKEAGIQVRVVKSGEYKAIGVDGVEITGDQLVYLQSQIDAVAEIFKADISSSRPSIPTSILDGRTFFAAQARELGLIDTIITMEDVVMADKNQKTAPIQAEEQAELASAKLRALEERAAKLEADNRALNDRDTELLAANAKLQEDLESLAALRSEERRVAMIESASAKGLGAHFFEDEEGKETPFAALARDNPVAFEFMADKISGLITKLPTSQKGTEGAGAEDVIVDPKLALVARARELRRLDNELNGGSKFKNSLEAAICAAKKEEVLL